jgi:hypothetical protein
MNLPNFDEQLSFLNRFILELVEDYDAGRLNSWEELDEKVKVFFTPERMDQTEVLVPGWKKMASYSDGITLTHVMCVFLGVFMMPEFHALSPEGQQMAKWIVLFHDLDKFHIHGKKDTMHAFRSGVLAARGLPAFGFPVTEQYPALIRTWSEHTLGAYLASDGDASPQPDNRKLPQILSGIDQLFGENTPAALITKTALLHISVNVDPHYPTPSPLTAAEIKRCIDSTVLPLLRVMMMGDNEGWALFEPQVRARQRRDTLAAFRKFEEIIAG